MEHLKKLNETYLQHFASAWKIIFCLKKMEIKCALHSIFPFLYTDAVSGNLKHLGALVNRTNSMATDDTADLYTVYGGD